MTKSKTQVKGVSVKGKTVRVRPTVSSDSPHIGYPQETVDTVPNAGHGLPSWKEKASYTLPSISEPLDTGLFERLTQDPNRFKAPRKQFGAFGGCNWMTWGLGLSVDFYGYERSIDFQFGPLYASVYYG